MSGGFLLPHRLAAASNHRDSRCCRNERRRHHANLALSAQPGMLNINPWSRGLFPPCQRRLPVDPAGHVQLLVELRANPLPIRARAHK